MTNSLAKLPDASMKCKQNNWDLNCGRLICRERDSYFKSFSWIENSKRKLRHKFMLRVWRIQSNVVTSNVFDSFFLSLRRSSIFLLRRMILTSCQRFSGEISRRKTLKLIGKTPWSFFMLLTLQNLFLLLCLTYTQRPENVVLFPVAQSITERESFINEWIFHRLIFPQVALSQHSIKQQLLNHTR